MATEILTVADATVSFDGFVVLDRLRFSVQAGELRFLIGPNGAGKTTLLDLLTGKVKPASGQVSFDGHPDLNRYEEHEIVRLGIGRKFQTPAVYPSLTVFENVEVALGFRRRLVALFRRPGADERD